MINFWIIGTIIILIDLTLLYFIRYDNEKVLKRWMILLAIIIGCIPIFNMIISSIILIVLLFALAIEEYFILGDDFKLIKWLNGTI